MYGLPRPLARFDALRSSRCIPYSIAIVWWGVVPAACLPHLCSEKLLQIALISLRSKVFVETAVRQIDAVRERSLSCLLVLRLQWLFGHPLGLAQPMRAFHSWPAWWHRLCSDSVLFWRNEFHLFRLQVHSDYERLGQVVGIGGSRCWRKCMSIAMVVVPSLTFHSTPMSCGLCSFNVGLWRKKLQGTGLLIHANYERRRHVGRVGGR